MVMPFGQTFFAKDSKPLVVDYVIDRSWISQSHERMHELAPPVARISGSVLRLVMARRFEDLHLLRLLTPKQLHVELRPHQTQRSKLVVRILTDGLQLLSAPKPLSRLRRIMWFHRRQQWLVLLETVIHFPSSISATKCSSHWRWVDFSQAEQSAKEIIGTPFRVLEVSCPEMAKGFLARALGSESIAGTRLRWLTRMFVASTLLVFLIAVGIPQIFMVCHAIVGFVLARRAAAA